MVVNLKNRSDGLTSSLLRNVSASNVDSEIEDKPKVHKESVNANRVGRLFRIDKELLDFYMKFCSVYNLNSSNEGIEKILSEYREFKKNDIKQKIKDDAEKAIDYLN